MCVAAAIAGAAVVGTAANIYAGNQAANAQEAAANQASATQREMYQQTSANLSPYNEQGQAATVQLGGLLGLPGYARVDPTKTLRNTPGYQFQFQQGNEAVQRNLAARGLLQSGAAGKALTQYGQEFAGGAYQQYIQNLQQAQGIGENAAAQTGNAGARAADAISGNQIYAGNARAAGYENLGNSIQGGLSGLAGAAGMYYGGGQNSAYRFADSAIQSVTDAGYQTSKRYMNYSGLT